MTTHESDLDIRIGIAIKWLRESKGLSQSELAKKAGVSQSCISLTENGLRNKQLSLKMLETIAKILGQNRLSSFIRFAEEISSAKRALKDAESQIQRN